MRPAYLTAYALMLPRLQAEETLRLVQAVAAGTGSLKREGLRSFMRGLDRLTRDRQERPARARIADVQALGIRVEEVPVKVADG